MNTPQIIENPWLNIVLYQPEIPPNTGNIARLCGAAEVRLHLIYPLGFQIDDKHLKRAGLDYWDEIDIFHHNNFEKFLCNIEKGCDVIAFSRHANKFYTEAKVKRGDYLLFGQETKGLPQKIMDKFPCYAIPAWGKVRSLNLSTSVGIVTYHYLKALNKF